MATIPASTKGLRHVRRTVTFTGGAGAGAIGTVTVFALTGRVLIESMTIWNSAELTTSGDPSILYLGTIDNYTVLINAHESIDYYGSTWVGPNGYISDTIYSPILPTSIYPQLTLSQSIILTIEDTAVTGGSFIFDVWYRPVTDDGALSGDDIDEPDVEAIFARAVEGSYTFEEIVRLLAAALAGKVSGAATTTVAIRDLGDTKDRITATVDADGNRSAITLDAS